MRLIAQHSGDGVVEGFIIVDAICEFLEGVQRLWWKPGIILIASVFFRNWYTMLSTLPLSQSETDLATMSFEVVKQSGISNDMLSFDKKHQIHGRLYLGPRGYDLNVLRYVSD